MTTPRTGSEAEVDRRIEQAAQRSVAQAPALPYEIREQVRRLLRPRPATAPVRPCGDVSRSASAS